MERRDVIGLFAGLFALGLLSCILIVILLGHADDHVGGAGAPTEDPVLDPGALDASTQLTKVSDIEGAEDSYFLTHGKYLQVKEGNALPVYETGTVSAKLGKDLPPNAKVHTYTTGSGESGYELVWDDGDNIHHEGFGPEAKERTYTQVKKLIDFP